MTKVRKLLASGKSVVIDDLRFPNEYHTLTNFGAERIRVERPLADEGDPRYEGQLEGYPFDYHLFNNAGIEDLRRAAKDIVHAIQLQS